ncbi:TetR/AcrR family transcriptional regulator [Eubacteriales bacterium OttesenSCG-928-K08]|nr:TetR/AcrR family transcriptional regulator [Eubacteriales bacterium OttesenSCG-928-K08]
MAKRGLDPDVTRENIRLAAAQLFMSNGVHASSLADIALAAGLSKGTLYYHYPTKENLVLEIAQAHFTSITEDMYRWIDLLRENTNARDAIEALSMALIQEPDRLYLHFALLTETMRENGALSSLLQTKQKEWSVLLEVGALKMTGPGAKRFSQYCGLYFSLLDGVALHRLLGETLSIEQLIELMME